ncbi:hypothetical protein ACJX0J_009440 [Zea mays]
MALFLYGFASMPFLEKRCICLGLGELAFAFDTLGTFLPPCRFEEGSAAYQPWIVAMEIALSLGILLFVFWFVVFLGGWISVGRFVGIIDRLWPLFPSNGDPQTMHTSRIVGTLFGLALLANIFSLSYWMRESSMGYEITCYFRVGVYFIFLRRKTFL